MFNTSDAPSRKQNRVLHSRHTTQKDVYNMHAIMRYLRLCAFHVYLHSIIESSYSPQMSLMCPSGMLLLRDFTKGE